MTNKSQQTVYIKWVRSGIGFTRRQKEMVRSLGLRRLNEIVERVDTPQIRGLVARIPHMVEIVRPPQVSAAWTAAPEYTIVPNEAAIAEPAADEAAEAPAQPAESSEVATGATEDSAATTAESPKSAKAKAAKDKNVKAATAGKKKAKLAAKPAPSAKAGKK